MSLEKRSKYVSGRVRIKSDVQLTNDNVKDIIDIVSRIVAKTHYDTCFKISQEVFDYLEYRICISYVKTELKGKKVIIKIFN